MNNVVEHWQFLNTGFLSGSKNMEVDEKLAQQLLRGEISSTLRVYGWKPWAISLGYNQKESEINEAECRARGIEIVRRPTGGRAILHANELTYSVVLPSEQKSIHAIYSEISRAIASGLRFLGAEIEFEQHQPDFQMLYKSRNSIPCFSSAARFEILHSGKKLVGSAQRRYTSGSGNEIVLQHGSILIGSEHQQLAELLNVPENEARESIRRNLQERTTTLNDILQRDVSFEEVASALQYGFESELHIQFIASPIELPA
ncbi:MAG: lipoate--protein ligase family protein [Bacteroidetes bacterium]|nr:lipoate--protein ligase family protein [Bacteroidota bacterium]